MLSFKQFLKELAPALLRPTINPATNSPIQAGLLQKRQRDNQKKIGAQPTATNSLATKITGSEIFY